MVERRGICGESSEMMEWVLFSGFFEFYSGL